MFQSDEYDELQRKYVVENIRFGDQKVSLNGVLVTEYSDFGQFLIDMRKCCYISSNRVFTLRSRDENGVTQYYYKFMERTELLQLIRLSGQSKYVKQLAENINALCYKEDMELFSSDKNRQMYMGVQYARKASPITKVYWQLGLDVICDGNQ